jgi:hypothetical protein
MQKFMEASARKFRENQVRSDKLLEIHSKYEMAQDELERPGDAFCE